MVANSPVLLTSSAMLCGDEAVFEGRAKRYDASVAGVTNEPTVTEQVAVLLPSAVVTVIMALPKVLAVTTPVSETVATAVLLLLHDTDLFVALEGATVAVNVSMTPNSRASVFLFKDTPVTDT
jgi:hypothetical protein